MMGVMNSPHLMRNADYRRWFVGDSLSAIGSSASTIAFPLLPVLVSRTVRRLGPLTSWVGA